MTDVDFKAVAIWATGNDTGASSKALAREAVGESVDRHPDYPSDPSDLGRCVRLIEAVPGVRSAVDRLAAKSPYWATLAPEWNRLVALYHEERASGSCPRTYAAMKALLNPVEDADAKVIRMAPGVTMRFGR